MKQSTKNDLWYCFLMLVILGLLLGPVWDRMQTMPVLEKQVKDLSIEKDNFKKQLDKSRALLSDIFNQTIPENLTTMSIKVSISAYTARPEETNDDPSHTAFMYPSRIGLLGVSPDLLSEIGLKKGMRVLLYADNESLGVFEIADKMDSMKRKNTDNPIPITRQVDILHATPEAAFEFGMQHNAKLTWIAQR